jgi:hypothetical protein
MALEVRFHPTRRSLTALSAASLRCSRRPVGDERKNRTRGKFLLMRVTRSIDLPQFNRRSALDTSCGNLPQPSLRRENRRSPIL